MGNASKINDTVRLPIKIDIEPYLRDHKVQDKVVFPAVESMQVLTANIIASYPNINVRALKNIKFGKFLYIPSQDASIEVFAEFENKKSQIVSRLITRKISPTIGLARKIEHAVMTVDKNYQEPRPINTFNSVESQKDYLEVPAEKIYGELVPFGPSYHNIIGSIRLSETGADATIRSPDFPTLTGPLGSPFPLDAAFHAACVWGQKYSDIIGFPVAIKKRLIFLTTQPGGTYYSRLMPVHVDTETISFNLWIYDANRELYEAIEGLMMRNVYTGGSGKSPAWLRESGSTDRS